MTRIRFGGEEVSFNFRARHHAVNALAALHAARALGLSVTGDVDVVFSPWRGEELTLPGGGILINDAYNANPASMRAALADLVDRADGRRAVAVLGDMAELGRDAPGYHRELGVAAADAGLEALVAVGELARHYLEGAADAIPVTAWVATAEGAIAEAQRIVEPGDCVLVKASRAVGLEVVAGALAEAAV
jgi:UDP-N-acetylmuramoyl-tripeptide--D-alanyl-D-alanine ligase